MVEGDSLPPMCVDELEDWIRVPASEADVQARVEGLRRRLSAQVQPAPDIDEAGVLRVGDRWVSLPPVEARLTPALPDPHTAVLSRDAPGRPGRPRSARRPLGKGGGCRCENQGVR